MNRYSVVVILLAGLAIVTTIHSELSAEPKSGPNETVMLKAQLKMYKSSLEAKSEEIAQLKSRITKYAEQVTELQQKISRLEALCRKNGVDLRTSVAKKADVARPTHDFRSAKWGMSRKQVIATEGKEPDMTRSGGLIAYNTKVSGMSCMAVYRFVKDQLVMGRYVFTVKHVNANLYLSDFDQLKEIITKKYGKPTEENVYWSSNLYKSNPNHWGMAISAGHLSKYTTWENQATKMIIALSGDNFKVHIGLDYYSKRLAPLLKAASEKKDSKGL